MDGESADVGNNDVSDSVVYGELSNEKKDWDDVDEMSEVDSKMTRCHAF